jgi:translation elongation factor EF-1beta
MKQIKKENWTQSDFKFEEIEIGMKAFHVEVGIESIVTDKTSSSIETQNYANVKNRYKSGQKDANGEEIGAGLKGINAKNWYTLDGFNRTFQRVL